MIQTRSSLKRTLIRSQYICCLLVLLFSVSAATQTKKAAEIDAYLKPLVTADHFSGVILASSKGRVIYEKAFGMAQAEHGVPNRADTVFNIASVNTSVGHQPCPFPAQIVQEFVRACYWCDPHLQKFGRRNPIRARR